MTDLEKRIVDALATLGAARGIPQQAPSAERGGRRAVTVRRAPRETSASARRLEGRYCNVMFDDGSRACFIHTVEVRSGGTLKAYLTRRDNGERCWAPLDRVLNIRDSE